MRNTLGRAVTDRSQFGVLLLLVCLSLGIGTHFAAAQETNRHPNHSKPAHLISIRFGQWGAWCEGYCSVELRVNSGEASLSKASRPELQHRYPDLTVRADLSTKHWQEIQILVDRDKLFALPGRTSCGTCVDDLDEFVEVKFSDHTRKSISYAEGRTPEELKELVKKLKALEGRLQKEFPR